MEVRRRARQLTTHRQLQQAKAGAGVHAMIKPIIAMSRRIIHIIDRSIIDRQRRSATSTTSSIASSTANRSIRSPTTAESSAGQQQRLQI